MRFNRPQVARPRPAATQAVDGAATTTPEAAGFDTLDLDLAMQHTVAELGFELATPIQVGAIPIAMSGHDVIGQAHTGSGKTAAFAIPIIERLNPRDGSVQALDLPTGQWHYFAPPRDTGDDFIEAVAPYANRVVWRLFGYGTGPLRIFYAPMPGSGSSKSLRCSLDPIKLYVS